MCRKLMAVCLAVAALGFGGAATADDLALADGTAWAASTEYEREAYLVGVANMLSVEYIVQSKAEQAPTDKQSSIGRWWNALESVTINQVMAEVDAWYAANPDKMSEPVLVVIWNSYVEND